MSRVIKRRWRRLLTALNHLSGGVAKPLRVISSDTGATLAEPTVRRDIYLASFVINLLGLGLPLVTLQVYDRILPHRARETLAFLLVGLAIALVFDLALRTARSALLSWQAMRFVRGIEHEAITRLLHAPPGTVEREAVGIHINRFAALSSLAGYHASSSRLVAIDAPFVFVTLSIIAAVGGLMVLVPITLFLLFGGLAIRHSRAFRTINEERSAQDTNKYDFLSDALAGILTVKVMAMEPQMLRRFERVQQSVAEINMRSIVGSHMAQSSAILYGSLSQIAIVAFGALRVIEGQMSVGALACCTMLSGQALQPLLRAISQWTEGEIINHRRSEVRKLLALPAVEEPAAPAAPVKGAIRFDQVGFARPGQKRTIVRGISLEIAPGTVVGLIGDDGPGRTTLLKLLLGDLTPTEGRISIDDTATTDKTFAVVRRCIAYVGARPNIFAGTILDNLTNFQPHRRNFARQMAVLAGLENAVNELPNGYDTLIGDNTGENVPASIAQQIGIVRALAAEPRVILLDDVTAVLDRNADSAFVRAIEKLRGGPTLVIATHQPSLLATCDVVYVLSGGQLIGNPVTEAVKSAEGAA
jgi:ATP-binding cassette, subfamily C, bacterial LapB